MKDKTIIFNEPKQENKYDFIKLPKEKISNVTLECDNEITKMDSLLKKAINNAQSKLNEIRLKLS